MEVYNTTLADASSHNLKTGCTFDIFTTQVNVRNHISLGISSLASLKRDDRFHSVYSTFQLRYQNICEPFPSIGSLVLDDLDSIGVFCWLLYGYLCAFLCVKTIRMFRELEPLTVRPSLRSCRFRDRCNWLHCRYEISQNPSTSIPYPVYNPCHRLGLPW